MLGFHRHPENRLLQTPLLHAATLIAGSCLLWAVIETLRCLSGMIWRGGTWQIEATKYRTQVGSQGCKGFRVEADGRQGIGVFSPPSQDVTYTCGGFTRCFCLFAINMPIEP
jgi:acyl-CoA synthetase (AMP-forming)/AMP-acid ligase II